MTEEELRRHCAKLRRTPMPVQGLYRVMIDLWKVDRMLENEEEAA